VADDEMVVNKLLRRILRERRIRSNLAVPVRVPAINKYLESFRFNRSNECGRVTIFLKVRCFPALVRKRRYLSAGQFDEVNLNSQPSVTWVFVFYAMQFFAYASHCSILPKCERRKTARHNAARFGGG
jgi:hypothetical protein